MSSLATIGPGQRLEARRDAVVVCIPVFGAEELFARALETVITHSPAGTTVLVADDATPGERIEALAREAADGPLRIVYLRQPANVGFVRNVNRAFECAAPADVVIVNSDVEVAADWLERLREAALSDPLIATASTLTNHGTILSVPARNQPAADLPLGLDEAAARVAEASLRLRPRIPTGIGHCLYIRRPALELVGGFDERFSPGYGEEVDFSQRCIARGLHHVAADDVLVLHRGGASFGTAARERQAEHERELNRRYPYYPGAVQEAANSRSSPLARSLAAARTALCGLSLTIDGSCLGPMMTGTQVHVLELTAALARRDDLRLRVTIPPSISAEARAALDELGVETQLHPEIGPHTRTDDVVHRPFQITTPRDLVLLRRLGQRVVVTQQDLIAYHNPAYFPDDADWHAYRELTRRALALADRVSFFSQAAADEALGEDLLEEARCDVVHIGIDHQALTASTAPVRPGPAYQLEDDPFLLCLGTDFLHKNRLFAYEVLAHLRRELGFTGRLVLAGPHASTGGSSAPAERGWLAANPDVAPFVVDLGAVSEAGKAWLYGHAPVVIYPTTKEGFGLVPFEAAEAGAATLWPAHSSLAEVLPTELASIVMWDARATALAAKRLFDDARARTALVEAVREAGRRWTWDGAAAALAEVYQRAAAGESRAFAGGPDELDELAMTLVGPRGQLPADVQQALFAVSTHRTLRRTVFGGLTGGYRAAYRARRMLRS